MIESKWRADLRAKVRGRDLGDNRIALLQARARNNEEPKQNATAHGGSGSGKHSMKTTPPTTATMMLSVSILISGR